MNILNSYQDTEECINDSYLNMWNAIPPKRPMYFRAFLGRIMRNLSLDKFRKQNAKKRRSGEFYILLSELEECIPSTTSVWKSCSKKILADMINECLNKMGVLERDIFIKRYFFCKKISKIAEECSISKSNTKIILYRARKKMREYLNEGGYEV